MNESKATRYQRQRRRLQALAWLLAGAALAVIALTPIGRHLHAFVVVVAASLPGPLQAPFAFALFVVSVVLVCEAAAWPAIGRLSFRLDAVYRRVPGTGAFAGRLQGTLLLLPAAVLAAALIWLPARFAGPSWWAIAGLALSSALVLAIHGAPLVFAGLAVVQPLDRPGLAARVRALADRAGVPVSAIQEWSVDDESAIAMVAGIGTRRRVLLARDVARHWSDDEVAVIVAHELAHHVHHDLLYALALNAVVLCGGLWAGDVFVRWAGHWMGVGGPGDLAALPALALVAWAVWLAATPLRLAQSRLQERRADRFALARTGQAEAFAAAVRRAGALHLAEEHPTPVTRWFYHRHPTMRERLALAESWERRRPN